MSLLQRLAHNWCPILSCYAHEVFMMAIVTLLYKLVVTEARWASVLAAWRPWSDRSLFMVATFLVHETMYLGASLCS